MILNILNHIVAIPKPCLSPLENSHGSLFLLSQHNLECEGTAIQMVCGNAYISLLNVLIQNNICNLIHHIAFGDTLLSLQGSSIRLNLNLT